MSLLLDTHVVLWWLTNDRRLGLAARDRISEPSTDVWVSAASAWEMAIKHTMGKLDIPDDLTGQLEVNGFTELPMRVAHGLRAGGLPLHHRDPFDRVLVAQAQIEGLTLCTADRAIGRYEVALLDATADR